MIRSAHMLVPAICDWAARQGLFIHADYKYDPVGHNYVFVFRHRGMGTPAHYIDIEGPPVVGELSPNVIEQIKATIRITQP